MASLDRSKSFGTISGKHFANYEQDNRFFDHEGKEVGPKAKETKPKPAPKAKETAK